MDLTNIYQENYSKALNFKSLLRKASIILVPASAGGAWWLLELGWGYVFWSSLLAVGAIFTLGSALMPVEKIDYFPQVKLGDLVIYNPVDDRGHSKYKISTEHPILNKSIPKWEVVSIGKTSLAIQCGLEVKEIPFSCQRFLFLQPKDDKKFIETTFSNQESVTRDVL